MPSHSYTASLPMAVEVADLSKCNETSTFATAIPECRVCKMLGSVLILIFRPRQRLPVVPCRYP